MTDIQFKFVILIFAINIIRIFLPAAVRRHSCHSHIIKTSLEQSNNGNLYKA